MFFRKKKPQSETTKNTPEVQNNKTNQEEKVVTPQETPVVVESNPSIIKRAFSFSSLDQSYENEATAIEYRPIGLFRKRRSMFEEDTTNDAR